MSKFENRIPRDLYFVTDKFLFSADESSSVPWKIIYLIIGISIVLLLSVIVFCLWKRKQNRASIGNPFIYHLIFRVKFALLCLDCVSPLNGKNSISTEKPRSRTGIITR